MKIAVSSQGRELTSEIDPRFGRCSYFLIINPDDMNFEAFENDSAVLAGGAGIQASQFLASKGVDAVITGNCGPNAVQTLSAAGIELFGEQAGTVIEVVERFKKGSLRSTNEATVDSHFGMAAGADFGRGTGMGRGMGGGRGMGRGMRMSGLQYPRRIGDGARSRDQELEGLKQQAENLNKKMKEVIARINKLEKK